MYPLHSHPKVFCFDMDPDTASPRPRDAPARVADDDDATTPVLAPGRALLSAAEVTPAVQTWINICHWSQEIGKAYKVVPPQLFFMDYIPMKIN